MKKVKITWTIVDTEQYHGSGCNEVILNGVDENGRNYVAAAYCFDGEITDIIWQEEV